MKETAYLSSVSLLQAGLTAETAWKAGESELICLHGGLRFHYIGLILCHWGESTVFTQWNIL